MRRFPLGIAIAGLLSATVVIPANGASPTRVFTHDDCGSTIYTNVILKSNVNCNDVGATTIIIGADKLTVNLNGYTLTGCDGCTVVYTNQRNGTLVTSGSIQAPYGAVGVHAYYSSTASVSKVNFTGNYYYCGCGSSRGVLAEHVGALTISNSTFSRFDMGLNSTASGVTVTGTTFDDNYFGVVGGSDSTDSFSATSFTHNTSHGLYLDRPGLLSLSNVVADYNGNDGVYVYADGSGTFTVSSSYFRNNGGSGFSSVRAFRYVGSSSSSSIVNSVASRNQVFGFVVNGPGTLNVKGNLAEYNRDTGLLIVDNIPANGLVTASYNTSRYNSGWGMVSDPGNVGGTGNRAYGNNYGQCLNFVCLTVKK